jgi:MoaA/NifB/PqqE/SkfB family radical SAM enzyme
MDDRFLHPSTLHLGLTSRCNLACPLCTRTMTSEKDRWFGTGNIDINFKIYKNFLDNLKIEWILLCGNWGDPIFYPELFQLLIYLKSRNIKIKIHTNGTGHNNKWWQELSNILTPLDKLYFSIDGVESNFTIYRRNASWNKIIEHISTVVATKNRPLLFWKYITFKYNENTILEAYDIAKKLKMDSFMLQRPWIPENKKSVEHLPGMNDYKQKDWLPSFSLSELVINNKKLKLPYEIGNDAVYFKIN